MKRKELFKQRTLVLITTGIFTSFTLFNSIISVAQTSAIDKKSFFKDDRIIEMSLVTDLKKLINEKGRADYEQNVQPATISFLFPDSTQLAGEAEIRPRGSFRREECYMPPIMINFKTANSGGLKKLGRLKFVWPCDNSSYYEQLVLKEYLVYKIYNLLTEKSFRVRLVKVEYSDVKDRLKSHHYYGFFLEDVDDLAKRNDCVEIDSLKFYTEQTNRQQTTLTALFQYMIGNTDWGIPTYHNIKLIQPKGDSLSLPFVIPYDFDCNGLVDASYALPALEAPINNVRQRAYRGFPRTMGELETTLQWLRDKHEAIDSLIRNCEPLSAANKDEMISYLDGFYKETADEKNVMKLFIKNARKE